MKKVVLLIVMLAGISLSCGSMNDSEQMGLSSVSETRLKAHIKFLSDDLLEGRATGSRGHEIAANYIASNFEQFGVEPAGDNGTYIQAVPLVGYTTSNVQRFEFRNGRQRVSMNYLDDFVANAGRAEERVILDKEIIFVGYGVEAPEQDWSDYKGMDMTDKILLMSPNDPPSDDPEHFGGDALTYYGRWTYKYEIAGAKGAAGVILIHTNEKAGYGWNVVRNSWSGEQFQPKQKPGDPQKSLLEGWITKDKAEALLALSEHNLEELMASASKADFQPVSLGSSLRADFSSDVRQINSKNVIGLIPGKKADEYIVYTSHLDHLGMSPVNGGDNIYNGAVDNATGSAGLLEVARAFMSMPEKPMRSIILISNTGEESGLLGSSYYANNPVVPANQTVANINIDSFPIFGEFKNIIVLGSERTSLASLTEEIAADNGLYVSPDAAPAQGFFFRSDQLSFARIGVPAIYLGNGNDFVGRPEGWGAEKGAEWSKNNYHQESDEYSDDWNMDGIVQMTKLSFQFGYRTALLPEWPTWNDDQSFKAIRDASLQK